MNTFASLLKLELMKFVPKIQQVIDYDHCITCGACIQICPKKNITPEFNKTRLAFEVKINQPELCAECPAPCDEVCPSITTNFKELLNAGDKTINREGLIENVYLGYSEKEQKNGVSSSGGIVRTIIKEALKNGDQVLCLTRQENEYLPEIITVIDQVKNIPGSIYHSIDFNNALQLLINNEKPVVLIATPCQLAGIRNYIAKFDNRLEDKIKLTIGLICGWSFSHHSIEAIKKFKKIKEPIIDVTYRGEDQVGNLKIATAKKLYVQNRAKPDSFSNWIDYRAAFSRTLNRMRCRVCQDHTNILSDISVGDAWLKRTLGEKLSVIVTRTKKGEDCIESLTINADLNIEKTNINDLVESQSKNLVYGLDALKMEKYLAEKNIHVPRFIFNSEKTDTTILTKKDRSYLKFDFYKRGLVFQQQYRKYRIIYMFTSIKSLLLEIYVKIKRKIKSYL